MARDSRVGQRTDPAGVRDGAGDTQAGDLQDVDIEGLMAGLDRLGVEVVVSLAQEMTQEDCQSELESRRFLR